VTDTDKRIARLEDELLKLKGSVLVCLKALREMRQPIDLDQLLADITRGNPSTHATPDAD
jgi:hypothetical protein